MRVVRPVLVALAAVSVLICSAPQAHAQVFGKNKVQYEPFDWAVLETPHLRLHYYAEEESLARRLAAFAESVCVEFDGTFRMAPRKQVPLLVFGAHHTFQQTNATPGLISEGTGGLTELIKGRVLVPHNGSWARLKWVTRHELVHWYMLEKISRTMKEHKRSQVYLPPLWWIEGLAEYVATTWDADAEGLLRDAVLSNEARPLTKSDRITGTVLMYKEGQDFLTWLGREHGREKVFDMLDNWWRADDFESGFKKTYGLPLKKADEKWFSSLRKRYYPEVVNVSNAPEVATRLTPRGDYNLGPRVIPPADPADSTVRFCYFSASEKGIVLTLNEPGPKGKRRERELLRGGESASYESFKLFQNRPDVSPSGRIALSSKRGGRDAIYVLDPSGKVERRLEFSTLVTMSDAVLVPGDNAVVFSGQDEGGRSDLYRAVWPAPGRTRLERLTNDLYDDLEPDVSPDGRWVVFSSDRGERDGAYSLYRLSLAGGVPEPVSDPGKGDDRQPVYSPDGRWIAYRSTRGGTSDLWVRPAEPSAEARRVTRLTGPARDPDWLANSNGLVFTGQNALRFHTYQVRFDPDTLTAEPEVPGAAPTLLASRTGEEPAVNAGAAPMADAVERPRISPVPDAVHGEPAQRYERRLGLDLVQNAVSVDPVFGGGGGGQIAISDLLGNEHLYISLSNESDRFGQNFFDGFEGGVTYLNMSRRLNYGIGLFRQNQIYDADLNAIRLERRFGLTALARYPFSKFTRVEGSVVLQSADNHLLRTGAFRDVGLVSNFVSFVHDNSRWSSLGPSGGQRLYLSAGYTHDMTGGESDFGLLRGELRRYSRPFPFLASATRLNAQASLGRDAQRNYLGGRNTLRGWDRRTLAGLRTVSLQQELRFPLLHNVVVALPTPWQLPPLGGALFADASWAWDDGRVTLANVPAYYIGDDQIGLGEQGHLGSAGFAVWIGGGYFPALRWNFAWLTRDFRTFSATPRTVFTMGYNF